MRKSACLLFLSKLVATYIKHLFGEASGSSVGAGTNIDINGVRAPSAGDLGGVFADTSTEEGGGSFCVKRSSIDKLWWDASFIFAEVGGKAQSLCKLASGDIGPAMLFLGSSWNEGGVEGSVDALRMHRCLPDVVYERMHSIIEGLAGAEGASDALLTDTVSSSSALLVVEAQHSHIHGGELKCRNTQQSPKWERTSPLDNERELLLGKRSCCIPNTGHECLSDGKASITSKV